MKVFITGQEKHAGLQKLLEAQIKNSAHQISDLPTAEMVIDLSSDQIVETDAPILALCWANSATVYAKKTKTPNAVTGFSMLPNKNNLGSMELAEPTQNKNVQTTSNLKFCQNFLHNLGLQTRTVPDGPGLVAARTVACLANEAFSALAEKAATANTINTAMTLGLNYPHGPLEWAEILGLENVLCILQALQKELGEVRYGPHPLLLKLVAARISIADWEQSKP